MYHSLALHCLLATVTQQGVKDAFITEIGFTFWCVMRQNLKSK